MLNENTQDDAIVEDGGDTGGLGFQPDDATLAWHNSEVQGLKSAQGKTLAQKKKAAERATKAEARVAELEAQLESINALFGDEAHGLDGMSDRLNKLREFESGEMERAGINQEEILERGRKGAEKKYEPRIKALMNDQADKETRISHLEAELHEHKYTNRLKASLAGVIKPGEAYKIAALGFLKDCVKMEDGELLVYDLDGEIAVDTKGHPITLEDYTTDVLPKRLPDLCIKDTAAPANGPATGRRGGAESNPWLPHPTTKKVNATKQADLLNNDPAKARRFMKAAGVNPSDYGL